MLQLSEDKEQLQMNQPLMLEAAVFVTDDATVTVFEIETCCAVPPDATGNF